MMFFRMAAIFLSLASIIKFAVPTCNKDEWKELDDQLKSRLAPFHHHLGRLNNEEDISHMGDQINIVIRDFLIEKEDLFVAEDSKQSPYIHTHNKTLEAAQQQKKHLKKKAFGKNATEDDKKAFWAACRAVSDLKQIVLKEQ